MKQTLIGAFIAVFLLAQPGHAQSAADLLQRGIFTQETTGDVDGAIKIYRQVVESASGNPANNLYAAQAQYRLVVCMLLKGDPAGATREFQLLEKNFPGQQDLVGLARTMMPGSSAVLPVPWPESEFSQLNIKRDGMLTGETLYYSVDPYGSSPQQQHQSSLRTELRTKNSTRRVTLDVDRETVRPINAQRQPYLESNDDSGDPAAEAFGGPAIDLEESVFLMRRLPLAAGYKTTLPTTSFTLGQKVPKQVDLAVTGIEPVQVTAGKYNCYKVSVSPLGQTFWIGIDGARPLVKFQSGKVEAELVRVWGPGTGIEAAVAFVPPSDWRVQTTFNPNPGATTEADVYYQRSNNIHFHVRLTKIYTPPAEIGEAMRQIIPEEVKKHQGSDFKIRQDSIKTEPINGEQAVRYIADVTEPGSSTKTTYYEVWIRTGGSLIEFSVSGSPRDFPVLRFWVEPLLETARIP